MVVFSMVPSCPLLLPGFGNGKAESNEGAFVAPAQWDILVN
jgi:hypothetical protein